MRERPKPSSLQSMKRNCEYAALAVKIKAVSDDRWAWRVAGTFPRENCVQVRHCSCMRHKTIPCP